MSADTSVAGGRTYRWYTCDRCGKRINDHKAFGVGDFSRWRKRRTYCVGAKRHGGCIPTWVTFTMWLRDDARHLPRWAWWKLRRALGGGRG